ncbi:membrane protein [alpha proteobacterium U9-1i]|nr:membrane protein [alpha proteobacterium U9-1i]
MIEGLLSTPALFTFGLLVGVGFIAQLIDGALGMAYGALGSTFLLSMGIPPAAASAAVHAAEMVTTGASGASHLMHKNVDSNLFWRLAPAGIVGGILGAYVLTGIDETLLKAAVSVYLGALGGIILGRAMLGRFGQGEQPKRVVPLGFAGGFLDASGGGGWGPVVTTQLLSGGHTPRIVIGTVNTAEFLVTVAISATFAWTLVTGRLEIVGGIAFFATIVGGLVLGGVLAAPFAGKITKVAPARALMGAVGVVVISLSAWRLVQVWPALQSDTTLTALAQQASLFSVSFTGMP